MLDEVIKHLNNEGISFKQSDDVDELLIVVGYNSDEDEEYNGSDDEINDIANASDVESVLDSLIDDGVNLTYYYDSYERKDGVTVEVIKVSVD